MGLNILVISFDYTLALDEDNVIGNAKARHIEYAKRLESLYIVVKTPKNIKCKVKKIADNLFVYPTSSLNKYFFLCDAYKLASKLCKKNKFDLIATQDPFISGLIGWLIKKRYHIPLNIHIAADVIDSKYVIKENIFNLFLNRLAKWLIGKADTIRVSTSKEKERLVFMGVDKEKIHVVPFFIDLLNFSQEDYNAVRQLNLKGKFNKIVLSVSRLVKQKNIETLIHAIPYVIKKTPKCLFLIIGSGSEEKYLKRLAASLDVSANVSFIGKVNYKDIPQYFWAADIFVSTSHYEGTSMVVQEAAASGKPVVSTSHTGAYDAIEDGKTGFILNFKDSINVAQKIVYLLRNPEIAKKMGEKGREFVLKRFDKGKILEEYLKMWEATAKRAR